MDFADKVDISGIPTYEFHSPPSVFDTTLEENVGMQYDNFEKINYVPGWPECPPKNSTVDCTDSTVDCRIGINFCHSCCNGSFYNDTYLLPPGLFPVKCVRVLFCISLSIKQIFYFSIRDRSRNPRLLSSSQPRITLIPRPSWLIPSSAFHRSYPNTSHSFTTTNL